MFILFWAKIIKEQEVDTTLIYFSLDQVRTQLTGEVIVFHTQKSRVKTRVWQDDFLFVRKVVIYNLLDISNYVK